MNTARLYNAGDRKSELIPVDNPYGHDNACKSYFGLEVPQRGFFSLAPDFMVNGYAVPVNFVPYVLARWGQRGVVLVDPFRRPEDIAESEPVAADDVSAILKAEKMWMEYLSTVVAEHVAACDRMRTIGGAPLEAKGFTKYALKELGIQDPGQSVLLELVKSTESVEMAKMREQMEEDRKQVAQYKEMLENLVANLGGAPKEAEPAKAGKEAEPAKAGKG